MRKDITIQSLTEIEDIQIGYLDKDIVLVDSIQKYVEVSSAHLSMNVIVFCIKGKIQALMNGQRLDLQEGQIAIVPPNVTVTDIMISPDFNLKAMFFTNRILQSFLREKISVWAVKGAVWNSFRSGLPEKCSRGGREKPDTACGSTWIP